MHGKKRILALVGVPLGASLALAPTIAASASAATLGKSAASGAASQPSITPTASCSISGIEDPNESATISGSGFTAGALVTFFSGKRAITTATANAAGAVSAVAVVKADDAVTAQEGANQQGCLNLVKPSTTSSTSVPGTTVPGTTDREQALAAGENDGDATCRQRVDLFKNNADKSASFRADYTTGFNDKVAVTAGCAAMLAQLRSGVPLTQNQNTNANANANTNQNPNTNQNTNQNQNQNQQQNQNTNQHHRGEGRGNR
ncbi:MULTISPECIES: hypothetical protein [unclassified Streptomyces]|uniref:hypothetical protein n=1 Tax=unclassified Streptomyces TaxID=2593676 RepID=UPI0036EE45BD